jgi:hypothetical protein
MRSCCGKLMVAVALAMAPAVAAAQGALPHHEYGVDLALVFQNVSSLGGAGSTSRFVALTPVDVRVGFVSSSPLSLEGRLTFAFNSRGYGANAAYTLAPDLNVLYRLGHGSGAHGLLGPYLTGGLGLDLTDAPNGAGGTRSGLVMSLNGGLGTRIAAGAAATRLEGFVAYAFKNATVDAPGTFSIGARVGLSLWH